MRGRHPHLELLLALCVTALTACTPRRPPHTVVTAQPRSASLPATARLDLGAHDLAVLDDHDSIHPPRSWMSAIDDRVRRESVSIEVTEHSNSMHIDFAARSHLGAEQACRDVVGILAERVRNARRDEIETIEQEIETLTQQQQAAHDALAAFRDRIGGAPSRDDAFRTPLADPVVRLIVGRHDSREPLAQLGAFEMDARIADARLERARARLRRLQDELALFDSTRCAFVVEPSPSRRPQ